MLEDDGGLFRSAAARSLDANPAAVQDALERRERVLRLATHARQSARVDEAVAAPLMVAAGRADTDQDRDESARADALYDSAERRREMAADLQGTRRRRDDRRTHRRRHQPGAARRRSRHQCTHARTGGAPLARQGPGSRAGAAVRSRALGMHGSLPGAGAQAARARTIAPRSFSDH
jgi:hypothetical protein